MRGLSCPAACGTSVLWPGIKPESPVLHGRFLTTGPPGSSQQGLVLWSHFICLFIYFQLGWVSVAALGLPLLVAGRLSSCGRWASLPHSVWDPPGSGIRPVCPALAGGFLTPRPLGKYYSASWWSFLTTWFQGFCNHSHWWARLLFDVTDNARILKEKKTWYAL